ncbi:hypothetical protein ACFSOZ_29365 [Mesorhizobium newzealandense]|uniref:Uncharacterized protein n=1 Tax=Mesorhizobium newzealandense TaxID=1300302 RepID=A0ABW4UG94_9HYPH
MASRHEASDPWRPPIGLSGEGNCAIDLAMVLICANDLQSRRAGGFFLFLPQPLGDAAYPFGVVTEKDG